MASNNSHVSDIINFIIPFLANVPILYPLKGIKLWGYRISQVLGKIAKFSTNETVPSDGLGLTATL